MRCAVNRIWLALTLGLAAICHSVLSPVSTAAQSGWLVRVNHVQAFQISLPPDWRMTVGREEYSGPNGMVRSRPIQARPIRDLAALCKSQVDLIKLGYTSGSLRQVGGKSVCDVSRSAAAERHVVMAYPKARTTTGDVFAADTYDFLLLEIKPASLTEQVLASIQFPEQPSPEAYLRGIADLFETRYFFADKFDFRAWEKRVIAALPATASQTELDQAVLRLLDELAAAMKHDHLNLITPSQAQDLVRGDSVTVGLLLDADGTVAMVAPTSAAQKAGLLIGDRIVSVNGKSVAEIVRSDAYTVVYERAGKRSTVQLVPVAVDVHIPARGATIAPKIAYLETFGLVTRNQADVQAYLDHMHGLLAQLDKPAACWIVDLRRNTGGRRNAILGGIAPLAGDGALFLVQMRDGLKRPLTYVNGRMSVAGTPERDLVPTKPYRLKVPPQAMAVLISTLTASGGEMSAFLLQSQTDSTVRVFGQRTEGLATNVGFYDLYNGGQVWIPGSLLTDLQDNTYLQGVAPDEPMSPKYDAAYGTEKDPMVRQSLVWLTSQPGCK